MTLKDVSMIIEMMINEDSNPPADFEKALSLVRNYFNHMTDEAIEGDIDTESFHIATLAMAIRNIFSSCKDVDSVLRVRDMTRDLVNHVSTGAINCLIEEAEAEAEEEPESEEVH